MVELPSESIGCRGCCSSAEVIVEMRVVVICPVIPCKVTGSILPNNGCCGGYVRAPIDNGQFLNEPAFEEDASRRGHGAVRTLAVAARNDSVRRCVQLQIGKRATHGHLEIEEHIFPGAIRVCLATSGGEWIVKDVGGIVGTWYTWGFLNRGML